MNLACRSLLSWGRISWPRSGLIASSNELLEGQQDLAPYRDRVHANGVARAWSSPMALELRFAHQPLPSWDDDVRTDADERALADRIRAGDMDAFEALYRRYWERLYTFAYRDVRNAARDRLERAAVARRWRISQREPPAEVQFDLEAADLVATVERALAELPAKRAEVCKLRLIAGLSYAQIAAQLGICEKTVETQLARGLKFLRDRIREAR